ncbi:TRAP transporter substrate-binding protein [Lentibacillus jeotgali]|uniref:TRAP transporter substrate-binding protein n=1 Tax=Lentibacillus jeotgali TaxID=558169 RepID=UPI00026287CD|nr:TRAP transporter substrate-binding protein DctP [Lentibacillus jeotgali]
MKNKFSLIILVIVLLLITGCDSNGEETANEEASGSNSKQIRIAYNLPSEHATGVYFEVLADEISKRTKNTSIHLKPQTFPNGQLYNDSELPDALSTGGVEIGQINIGFLASSEAEPLRIVDLPFIFSSWEAEWAAEDGEYGEIFGEQFEKMGMKLLGWSMYGTVEVYGNEPIKVPEDLKGKKMRAFGQGSAKFLEEIGASPVSISSQEIYQSMEHGTIDGFMTGPSSVVDRSLHEVSKYGTNMAINYIPFPATANLEWWNSLPEDVQSAVIEASKIAQEKSRQVAKESDKEYKQKLKELGVEVYEPTEEEYEEWVEASSQRREEYVEQNGELGQKLLDIVDTMNEKYP